MCVGSSMERTTGRGDKEHPNNFYKDIRYEVFNCNSEIRKLMVEKWNSSAYIRPMPKKNDSFNSPYHSPIELLSGIFKVLSRIFNRKELNSITS